MSREATRKTKPRTGEQAVRFGYPHEFQGKDMVVRGVCFGAYAGGGSMASLPNKQITADALRPEHLDELTALRRLLGSSVVRVSTRFAADLPRKS